MSRTFRNFLILVSGLAFLSPLECMIVGILFSLSCSCKTPPHLVWSCKAPLRSTLSFSLVNLSPCDRRASHLHCCDCRLLVFPVYEPWDFTFPKHAIAPYAIFVIWSIVGASLWQKMLPTPKYTAIGSPSWVLKLHSSKFSWLSFKVSDHNWSFFKHTIVEAHFLMLCNQIGLYFQMYDRE